MQMEWIFHNILKHLLVLYLLCLYDKKTTRTVDYQVNNVYGPWNKKHGNTYETCILKTLNVLNKKPRNINIDYACWNKNRNIRIKNKEESGQLDSVLF